MRAFIAFTIAIQFRLFTQRFSFQINGLAVVPFTSLYYIVYTLYKYETHKLVYLFHIVQRELAIEWFLFGKEETTCIAPTHQVNTNPK